MLFITTWQEGSPLTLKGMLNKTLAEDKGTTLAFEKEKLLTYTRYGKFWRLPDEPEYYYGAQLSLEANGGGTTLVFTQSNLVTEAVYGLIIYFWLLTLHRLKEFFETWVDC